jgi:hypothetical protein
MQTEKYLECRMKNKFVTCLPKITTKLCKKSTLNKYALVKYIVTLSYIMGPINQPLLKAPFSGGLIYKRMCKLGSIYDHQIQVTV